MATTPSQVPVPSEKPQDLRFNAGKLDEFVTSSAWTYADRFGKNHLTIEGINHAATQAMMKYGYITKKSFELGATLDTPNTVLQWESNGEYYRWDGDWSAPKVVPAGATPDTAGGTGAGKWVGVGDASLRSDLSSDIYQFLSSSDNYTADPGKLVYGTGKVTIGNVEFSGFLPGVDISNSSIYMTPPSYYDLVGDNAEESGKLNLIFNVGAKRSGSINRSTFVGTQGPKQIIGVDRCEAFGNGAMMYTKYCERTVAIGTIACQWLGTNSPAADNHQWWSNAGGYTPGQAGWDYDGLETDNPGIGAKISAFSGFATQQSECGRSVAVGRNAFNGSVLLMNCTALGYRAGAGMYSATNMVALGTDAYRNGVFLTNSIAAGVFAGVKWQEGTGNALFGYNAGSAAIKGDRNTLIGSYAGSDSKALTDCIFIGYGGGNDVIADTPTPTNVLAIGNDVTGVGAPLISGNMAVPKAGVNILPSKIAATWHVRSSDASTTVIAPSGAADELILENGGNTGMTIRSAATSLGVMNFSSPTVAAAGAVSYNHSTSEMTLRASNGDRWKVTSSALVPAADNSYTFGTAALRPSQLYAGNSSISTSDATRKTEPREINDAEISAFSTILKLPGVWQWLDKYQDEGDKARLHSGPTVQAAIAIMEANGLDWQQYGAFCYDQWEDQYTPVFATRKVTKEVSVKAYDGISEESSDVTQTIEYDEEYDTGEKALVLASGSLYSFRKEELTWWCMRALYSKLDDIESRLSALEAK